MGNRRDRDMGKLNSGDWESQLRSKVSVMRELGVVAYDGVTLGPAPLPKEALKKLKDDPFYEKRAYYENLLGRVFSDDDLKKLPEVA